MKVSNISPAKSHKDDLGKDPGDIHLVSEASLALHEIEEVKTYIREWYANEAKFTGTDSESGHLTGGVGAVAKAPHRLVDVKPITAEFKELDATGRVALYALEAKGGHTQTFVVIYGWTGARKTREPLHEQVILSTS